MSEADDAFLADLAEMSREYAGALPARFAEMAISWERVRGGDLAAMHALVTDAHYLAGTGATFGLPSVSVCAGELEAALWPLVQAKSLPDAATSHRIAQAMASLHKVAEGPS